MDVVAFIALLIGSMTLLVFGVMVLVICLNLYGKREIVRTFFVFAVLTILLCLPAIITGVPYFWMSF